MKRVGNFYVIGLIDRIGGERILRVQCVCGTVGKISESSLKDNISCGCSEVVRPHRLGLKIHCYTFTRFVGEEGGKHLYEIECEKCDSSGVVVPHSYSRDRCPACPKIMVVGGQQIDLSSEAERIGIHVNALRQRLQRMEPEKALSMPRKPRGGCRGKHGKCMFRGVLDTIPGHLRRVGALNKKGSVYYWVRRGMKPEAALEKCVDTQEGLEVLQRLFPAQRAG